MLAKPKPADEPSSTIATAASVQSPATDDREAEIERRLALLTPAMDEVTETDIHKDTDTPPDVTIEDDLLAPVVVSPPPPVPVVPPVPAVKEVKSNPKSALLVSLQKGS